MARFHSFLAVSSAIFFIVFVVPASGQLEVTKPYPGHVVAIQGEEIKVKCVVVNFQNGSTIDSDTKIDFYKITDRFGGKKLINVSDDKHFSDQKTDYYNGVPRYNGTLIINNMTSAEQGQYECDVNNTYARYGFGISYIEKKDLPEITSSEDKEVDFNVPVTLSCGLVKKGNKFSVKLVSIAWFKGNTKLDGEIKHPAEETLDNLTLTMNKPNDAGTYRCQLTSILRHERNYIITEEIHVKVKPSFTKESQELTDDDREIIKKKGESAMIDCGARGNPIEIIWMKQGRSETTKTTLNQTGNSSKYIFSSKNKYEGFKLEIRNLDYEDRGEYFCCIKSSNASDQCQEYTIRVKDPLGWLWPLIGIICGAILIILILVIAAKFEAKKEETYESDANTELSYTITNEGSTGHIRLRNTGATAT